MGKARLEEKFIEAWRGREDSDCLWWNGEWWTWRRFAALVDDCTAKLEKAGFVKGQRLAVLLPTLRRQGSGGIARQHARFDQEGRSAQHCGAR